jgi:hypothetical protein
MHAKYMLDDATVDVMTGLDTSFGIDQETLATDGAADVGGYLRWLAQLHGRPAFLLLPFRFLRESFSTRRRTAIQYVARIAALKWPKLVVRMQRRWEISWCGRGKGNMLVTNDE